jgi:hypothetical protein
MFFDQLNERNTMVQSNIAFEKVWKTVLADFSSVNPSKNRFLRPGSK